jgi:hypothetical protein
MGYVVTQEAIDEDLHLHYLSCTDCHQGNAAAAGQSEAHAGMIARPSDDPVASCGTCHEDTANNYTLSLHYTAAGMRHGLAARFNPAEQQLFDQKVFEQSCRSCHASCGDCHVKSPVIGGVNSGLIDNHRFVRKDETKTCALCHGGRVWPEFTGDYGGMPDIHYRRGMTCTDCHSATQMHGDGMAYTSRRDVPARPLCLDCHDTTRLGRETTIETHAVHEETVSCSACHTAAAYRQCSSCHEGKGAVSSPAIILGRNPRNPEQLTTLRLIPTVRNTFLEHAGLSMSNYDALPNYWDAIPHNIAKRTDRTRDCNTCHADYTYYLEESMLKPELSSYNKKLVW